MYLPNSNCNTSRNIISPNDNMLNFNLGETSIYENLVMGTNLSLSISKDDTSNNNKNVLALMRFWVAVISYHHLKLANGFCCFLSYSASGGGAKVDIGLNMKFSKQNKEVRNKYGMLCQCLFGGW